MPHDHVLITRHMVIDCPDLRKNMPVFESYWSIIRRLGVARLVQSIVSHRYRRDRAAAGEILSEMDSSKFLLIREKYWIRNPGEAPPKYLHIKHYMQKAVSRVVELGLDRLSSCRVLDIGCGNGYFMAAARHFGHDPVGIDIFDEPMYAELIALMGLQRIEHRVMAREPLPQFDSSFDVITAYMVCFNRLGHPEPWTADDWFYFLDDCRSKLNAGGRIYLELNPDKRSDFKYLSDETAHELRSYPGAMVSTAKDTLSVQL